MGQVESSFRDGRVRPQALGTEQRLSGSLDQRIGDSNATVTYGARVGRGTGRRKRLVAGRTKRMPRRVDLRKTACKPYFSAFSQANTGTCTSQAVVAAFMCSERKVVNEQPQQGYQFVVPSVLFNYYYARRLDNSSSSEQNAPVNRRTLSDAPLSDTGASLVSALQASVSGMASDTTWRFAPNKVNTQPPRAADLSALHSRTVTWEPLVEDLRNVKAALVQGVPVLMSFQVLRGMDDWFTTEDLQLQTSYMLANNMMERSSEVVGGHSVLVVGYDDDYLGKGALLCRNSWGPSWGQQGHFWYQYDTAIYPDNETRFYVISDFCSDPTESKYCTTPATCRSGVLQTSVCDTVPPDAPRERHHAILEFEGPV